MHRDKLSDQEWLVLRRFYRSMAAELNMSMNQAITGILAFEDWFVLFRSRNARRLGSSSRRRFKLLR